MSSLDKATQRPLELSIDWRAGQLRLIGELDRFRVERLTDAVSALDIAPHSLLIVDVSELTFCDVEGLHALARVRSQALGRGRRIVLVNASSLLVRMLQLAGLGDLVVTTSADRSASYAEHCRPREGGPEAHADVEARAYCGPAHGQRWTVDASEPPAWVELPVSESSCLYRLVRQRRTGRPARDDLGNVLYVPMTGGSQAHVDAATTGLVLRFPGQRRRDGSTTASQQPGGDLGEKPSPTAGEPRRRP
ncbi:hypothetical protein DQ237_15210 [Blastococcus sp. TF02-8]|uniref:STAS domain-containing protein n=1 Tax=Blastococcus sp. TF02-8 TaxID=2250574 RepID=UPI000DE9EFE4|nr:STAS domain-containing protein [Blastococcus sp. TF02-8]RBY95401.1 hypothetical protein DQ237_15210 [Blastococcus sp. TF02-8]